MSEERELERHKKIDDNYKQKKTQFDDALNNNSSNNNWTCASATF